MGNCISETSDITTPYPNNHIGAAKDGYNRERSRLLLLPPPPIQRDDDDYYGKDDDKIFLSTPPKSEADTLIFSSPDLKPFTLNDLKNVTGNFSPENLIGEGGFGYVYKGWVNAHTIKLVSGTGTVPVAVKKLKSQGFQGHKEWLSELNHLGQLHHPNLVKLIGYCLEGDNRLLVYEYMTKGSLENHLFNKGDETLSWGTRIKVAIGAARGLTFLHESEHQVIYRDFKPPNILLDSEFNAKLTDFGLAKSGPIGDLSHVSTTQVLGTRGYAAPEYILTGRLTTKCDVYSFGVVLLELLTGRHAIEVTKSGVEDNLVEWAKPYLGDRKKLFRIMDTKLAGKYSKRAAYIVSLLALQCISDANNRPKMHDILSTLERLQLTNKNHSHRSVSSSPTLHSVPNQLVLSPLRHNNSSNNNNDDNDNNNGNYYSYYYSPYNTTGRSPSPLLQPTHHY
ncbi:putative serine/threonine-protein kinase pbl3 [Stylosanthes scabra]|uniref:Serine/threonine-protein kinase pbl3 n=1 Tax=Stylosanthes scabra TaxID=79078 RepID=A0ABU6STH2_9FABA|nr:putative serine/threonine-protein kinase pbl3 [Stylosanthes scabra]